MSHEEAIALVLAAFADRPSGPDGYDILDALEECCCGVCGL